MDLDPGNFGDGLRVKLDKSVSDEELDIIDDYLISSIEKGDRLAVVCAEISVDILSEYERPWSLAYSLNTLIVAFLSSGDIASARKTLRRLVDHSIEFNTPQAGLSGVDNVGSLFSGVISIDHIPYFLPVSVRFYLHFNLFDKAVDALLKAAAIFSDFGAFQPAYRALGDAEEIAKDNQLGSCLAKVLSASSGISLLEGDHDYCRKVGAMAVDLYETLDIPVPNHLVVNIATAAMQTNDHQRAIESYEFVLSSLVDDSTERFPILTNLSACYRQIGDLGKAKERLFKAREVIGSNNDDTNYECRIELELISAAIYIEDEDFNSAASSLKEAVEWLFQILDNVLKLHYRRGVRERYVPRIEGLLCKFPEEGDVGNIIPLLAFSRSNQASDWMHILSWYEEISEILTVEDKARLDNIIIRLTNFGVPFLYGYREKYNDPFESDLSPDPWPQFNELSLEVCARYGFREPLSSSSLEGGCNLISQRLNEGYGVLVGLLTGGGKAVFLIGSRYHLCDLPKEETQVFHQELSSHRQGSRINGRLNSSIIGYQSALIESFSVALGELVIKECCGLIYMPDRYDLIPINLVAIGYEGLRSRMEIGDFQVRTCVALYPGKSISPPTDRPLALLEEAPDLRFARAEISSLLNVLQLSGKVLEDPVREEFYSDICESDALFIAQHGVPVGLFADPHFANMSGVESRGVLSFDTIQQSVFRWPHRLVILGSCHSGVNVSRNYQNDFKSHELIGFPSIFLLNRKCAVVAGSWAIVDRFGYLFSTLFAKEMNGSDVSKAFSIALAKIVSFSESEAVELYDYMEPSDFKEEVKQDACSHPISNLIKKPACYGAYQIYTLF